MARRWSDWVKENGGSTSEGASTNTYNRGTRSFDDWQSDNQNAGARYDALIQQQYEQRQAERQDKYNMARQQDVMHRFNEERSALVGDLVKWSRNVRVSDYNDAAELNKQADAFQEVFTRNKDVYDKQTLNQIQTILQNGRAVLQQKDPAIGMNGAERVNYIGQMQQQYARANDRQWNGTMADAWTAGDNPNDVKADAEGRLNALRRQNQELKRQNKLREYESVMQNPDFAENSKYQTTANGKQRTFGAFGATSETGFGDLTYDLVNKNREAIKARQNMNPIAADVESREGTDQEELQRMTDDEVQLFNYYYSQDPDKAREYLNTLRPDLMARQSQYEQEEWKARTEKDPVWSSVLSVPARFVGGLDAMAGMAADKISGRELDTNAGYLGNMKISNAIRETAGEMTGEWLANAAADTVASRYNDPTLKQKVLDKFGGSVKKFGNATYGAVMSAVDQLWNLGMTGGSQTGALLLMSSSAMPDTIVSAKERGLSDKQAIGLGIISGVAEYFTEKVSLEALLDMDSIAKNGFLKYVAKAGLAEGSEEVASDFINLVADEAIAGKNSNFKATVKMYQQQGMSHEEAVKAAWADQVEQAVYSFIGGAIAGGGMAVGMGGAYSVNEARKENAGAKIKESLPENSPLRQMDNKKLYEYYANLSETQKADAISNTNLRQAAEQMAAGEEIMPELTEAIMANDNTLGMLEQETETEINSEEDMLSALRQYAGVESEPQNVPTGVSEALLDRNKTEEQADRDFNFVNEYAERYAQSGLGSIGNEIINQYNDNYNVTEYNNAVSEVVEAGLTGQSFPSTILPVEAASRIYDVAANERSLINGRSETVRLQGNTGRVLSESAGRQSEGVGSSTAETYPGRGTAEQTKVVRGNTFQLSAEQVTAKSLGIPNGTDTTSVQIVTGGLTPEMTKLQNTVRKRGNTQIHWFVGDNLSINGQTDSRGLVYTDSKGTTHIFARADHPVYTADQIALHELYHDGIAREANRTGEKRKVVSNRRFRQMAKNFRGDFVEKFMLPQYVKIYEGTGLTLNEVREELLCDMAAGMNEFAKVKGLMDIPALRIGIQSVMDVRMREFENELAAEETGETANETRGSPQVFESKEIDFDNNESTGIKFADSKTYSPEKIQIINNYLGSYDSQLRAFLDDALQEKNKKRLEWMHYDFENNMPEKIYKKIESLTGVDVRDYELSINGEATHHLQQRHGKQGENDLSMRDLNDAARMQFIFDNADGVEWVLAQNGQKKYDSQYRDKNNNPSPVIRIFKKIDGTYYIGTIVQDAKAKRLRIKSAYIETQKMEVDQEFDALSPKLTSSTSLDMASNNNIPQPSENGNSDFKISGNTARWTDERIDSLIRDYGASNPNYSQAYAALMNPRDYLKLTLSDDMLDKWNEGSNDPNHPETYSLDEGRMRENTQTPFLSIYSNDGTEVQGHEGRHRMRALLEAGVTSVPVVIRDMDTKYSKTNLESMTLSSQDFGDDPVNNGAKITVTDLVPIKEANREELIRKFGGDANVRFSRDLDSEGRQLSEGQMEFYKNVAPELRDENGNIKPYFHGTGRADRVGTVFLPERATSGPMAFFTDDREIAERYSKDKADTSLAYEDANNYHKQFVVDVDGEEILLEDYWNILSPSEKDNYRKRAGQITYDDDYEFTVDENVSNGNGGYATDPVLVRQAKGNAFRMLVDAWLDSGDLYGEEERFLDILNLLGIESARYKDPNARVEGVYEVYLNVTRPFVTTAVDEDFASDVEDWLDNTDWEEYVNESWYADEWDKNNIDPYDWLDRLRRDIENNTTHAWTSIPDAITAYLKENGYDGIVDQGGKLGGYGHQVVIPFSSNQVKSVDNLNPTDDPDIRFSRELDARYLELAKEPEANREELQRMVEEAAREAGYNSPKLYHGTRSFGFTTFDTSKSDDKISIFTSADEKIAQTYSGNTNRKTIGIKENPDYSKLSPKEILARFNDSIDGGSKYHLVGEKERKNIIEDIKLDIASVSNNLRELIDANANFFDEDQITLIEEMITSLNDSIRNPNETNAKAFNDNLTKLIPDRDVFDLVMDAIRNFDRLFSYSFNLDSSIYAIEEFSAGNDLFVKDDEHDDFLSPKDAVAYIEEKGIYALYGKTENMLEIDANGDNWSSIKIPKEIRDDFWVYFDEGMFSGAKTRQYADYANGRGYNGVIIRNVRDSGGRIPYNEPSDIYIYFGSASLKSADPVTYDDDGNVIPLSERFNSEKQDIRYSRDVKFKGSLPEDLQKMADAYDALEKDYKKLQTENRKNRGRAEYFKGETRLNVYSANPQVSSKAAEKIAKDYIKTYNLEMDKEEQAELTRKIRKYAEDYLTGKKDFSQLADDVLPLANEIVRNAKEIVESPEKEMIDHIWNTKIKISDTVRKDIPDYANWKRGYAGKMKISTMDGMPVEDLYRELQDAYGATLFPDDIMNPTDMLMHIAEITDTLGGDQVYNFTDIYDMAEATQSVAFELMQDVMGMELHKTFADKEKEKRTQLKKEMQQKAQESINAVRQHRDEKLQALKDHYKEVAENKRIRREASELRAKIQKHVKSLSDLLLKPTDQKHIPKNLQSTVAKLLESINLESTYKDKNGEIKTGAATKRTVAFQELRTIYTEMAKGGHMVIDPDLMGDNYTTGLFDEVIAMGDTSIMAMNSDQLKKVWRIVRAVETAVRTANKLFIRARYQDVSQVASVLHNQNEDKTKSNINLGKAQKLLSLDMLTPEAYFHRLGDAGDYLFKEMRNAQDRSISIYDEAVQYGNENLKGADFRKLEKEMHEVTLGGQKVSLSTAQLMELYLLMNRDQAREHILNPSGGLKLRDVKNGVKMEYHPDPIKGIKEKEIFDAMALLSPQQIAWANSMQQYVAGPLADHGNQASMQVYGYEKFTDDNYWKITSNEQDVRRDIGQTKGVITSVAGKGMAQPLTPKANTSIMLGSIFDTYSHSVMEMADYAAWLATMEDINRIRNYQAYEGEGDERHRAWTMQQTFDRVFGNGGAKYLETLMSHLANGVNSEQTFFGGFTGNYKAAVIGYNIRVVIQQPTAIFRATDMISPKYLAAGAKTNVLKGWEEAKKYCPIAVWKDWGFFDIGTGRQMKSILFKDSNLLEKIKSTGMWAPGMADSIGWGWLWNSIKKEVKATTKLEGEEFYKRVAERFNDVVDHTQVVDGVLQRSDIMRRSDALTKMAVSFMAEPMKQYNMLMSAAYDCKNSKGEKLKIAKRRMARCTGALLLAGILNAVAQSIIDGLRNGDRDKDYWEKFLAAMFGEGGEDKNRFVEFIQSNTGDMLNPAGYIPFAKDILSLIEGYDVSRMDMDAMSESIKSAGNLIKAIQGNSKETLGMAIVNAVASFGQLLGISFKNLKREVLSVASTSVQATGSYVAQYNFMKMQKSFSASSNKNEYMQLLYDAYDHDRKAYNYLYNEYIKRSEFATSDKSSKEYVDDKMKAYVKETAKGEYWDESKAKELEAEREAKKQKEKAAKENARKKANLTSEQWLQYERLLVKHDENLDGSSSQKEVYDTLMEIAFDQKQKEAIWKSYGYKKTMGEYKKVLKEQAEKQNQRDSVGLTEKDIKNYEDALKAHDADKDGSISKEEVYQTLMDISLSMQQKELLWSEKGYKQDKKPQSISQYQEQRMKKKK